MRNLRGVGAPEAFVAFGGSESSTIHRRLPSANPISQVQAATDRHAPRTDDTIVVLRRETATMSFAAGESSPASEIINRLGQALAAEPRVDDVTQRQDTGQQIDSTPLELAPAQITYLYDEPLEIEADDLAELDADPATSDAAIMAGRLRPVRGPVAG